MRYVLPAAALATAIVLPGIGGPAMAKESKKRSKRRAQAHISLHVSSHDVLSGSGLVLSGRVRPGGRHRVKVVVRGASGEVLTEATDRRGRFRARWAPPRTGTHRLRAYGIHDRHLTGSESVARRVTAYRRAAASYYGPGLYGGALACGGTLRPETLGVANKTLPCGTRLRLRYHGRSITVAVVDRGPYVAGRDFDLTAATKARLGFPSTGVVLSSR
jgi:hypothetical protein